MIFLKQNHHGKSNSNRINPSTSGTNRHCNHHNHIHELNVMSVMMPPSLNNNVSRSVISRQITPQNNSTTISSTTIENSQSITINERLASIGGLFGALSIIITGALLYGVFTAKSNEKWYYIVAVLVNISLLIFLMLAAILFDRVYLRKRREITNQRAVTSAQLINMAAAYQSQRVSQPRYVSTVSVRTVGGSESNDVPPKYPGHLIEEIKNNNNLNSRNSVANNLSPVSRQVEVATVATTVTNGLAINSSISTSSSAISPPDYYDLYPNFNRNSRPDSNFQNHV